MSQLDFIRETVSDFFDALIGSNLADSAMYTDPQKGSTPVSCRVLVRRAINPFGNFGNVLGQDIELRIPTADVPAARRDGTVQVTSAALGTETFKLVEKLNDTGALTTWRTLRV